MTPEKARALREDATPGPWEVEEFEEQYAGCPPTTKFYLGSDNFQNIATAETTERYYDQTRANFALIAAAPGLAELVAGLRYEYMVQANDREWVRENDEGRFVLTGDPMRALRHYHPGVAVAIAKGASARFDCECRVVRRLVGELEVAE